METREKNTKRSELWPPSAHQEEAEVQRVEKRKEITAGKKNRTMERESEEGSMNCNKPRARQKSLTHTQKHTPWHTHPDYTSLVRIERCSRKTRRSKCSLRALKPFQIKTTTILRKTIWPRGPFRSRRSYCMTFIGRWEFAHLLMKNMWCDQKNAGAATKWTLCWHNCQKYQSESHF